MIRHFVNIFLALLPPTRLFTLRRFFWRLSKADIGDGACLCGGSWIYGPGSLHIGEGTWLSPGFAIFTHRDAPIRIGARCDLGHGVTLVTGSHEMGGAERRAGPGTAAPITIGDGSWIGARTLILGGVTIGSGCMIAAGSVVAADIPANSFAAGVPARIKRHLNP